MLYKRVPQTAPRSIKLQTLTASYGFSLVFTECLGILTSNDDSGELRLRLGNLLSSVLKPPIRHREKLNNSAFTEEEINALTNTLLSIPQGVVKKLHTVTETARFNLDAISIQLTDLIFPVLREGVDSDEDLRHWFDVYSPVLEGVIGGIIGLSFLCSLAKEQTKHIAKQSLRAIASETNPIDFFDRFFGSQAENVKAIIQNAIAEAIEEFAKISNLQQHP